MWWYVHAGQGQDNGALFAHVKTRRHYKKRESTVRVHNSEPVRVVCQSKLFAWFNLLFKGGNLIAVLGWGCYLTKKKSLRLSGSRTSQPR